MRDALIPRLCRPENSTTNRTPGDATTRVGRWLDGDEPLRVHWRVAPGVADDRILADCDDYALTGLAPAPRSYARPSPSLRDAGNPGTRGFVREADR